MPAVAGAAPGSAAAFQVNKDSLHIWPRGSHFMMGLANRDGSFTMTLYMHERSPSQQQQQQQPPAAGGEPGDGGSAPLPPPPPPPPPPSPPSFAALKTKEDVTRFFEQVRP
jgi:hypothetical protein